MLEHYFNILFHLQKVVIYTKKQDILFQNLMYHMLGLGQVGKA